ncbi:MAG: Asp23/Gls24 family envelope stress response protein [Anaerolineales bacterium]
MQENEVLDIPGSVTTEPEVLEMMVWLAANEVSGVVKIKYEELDRFLGSKPVSVQVENGRVTVDLHVIAKPNQSLLQLGRKIQREVTRTIQQMIGMPVNAVHVYIDDVVYPQSEMTAEAMAA